MIDSFPQLEDLWNMARLWNAKNFKAHMVRVYKFFRNWMIALEVDIRGQNMASIPLARGCHSSSSGTSALISRHQSARIYTYTKVTHIVVYRYKEVCERKFSKACNSAFRTESTAENHAISSSFMSLLISRKLSFRINFIHIIPSFALNLK